MKIKIIAVSAAIIGGTIMFSSCGTFKKPISTTGETKWRDVYGVGVVHIPTVADLDVQSEKVQGTFSGKAVKNKESKKLDFNEEACKNLAVINALEKSGADILIEPRFTVDKVGAAIMVTVTGYPATYKNFRSMTPKDTSLLQVVPTRFGMGKAEVTIIQE
jgi:hypothetical protein